MRKRRKGGFTLTEMLISVLLLGFVSIMVTVMTSAILSSTVNMQEVAQAEILGSEALDNLQGRLRTARNVKVNSENVTFDLDTTNTDYTFAIEDGKIVLGKVTQEGETFKGDPLFAGVSYGNLSVSRLLFSGDGEMKTIKISVEISYGEKMLWNGSATVKPLNGITAI